jgi:hypothetical protein
VRFREAQLKLVVEFDENSMFFQSLNVRTHLYEPKMDLCDQN